MRVIVAAAFTIESSEKGSTRARNTSAGSLVTKLPPGTAHR